MGKIDKLTPEQEVQLEQHYQEYLRLGLSTERIDIDILTPIVEKIYGGANLKAPEIMVVASPKAASDFISEMTNELPSAKYSYFWGSMDLYWVALYKFSEKYLGVEYTEEQSYNLDLMDQLGQNCGWIYFFDTICIACERPTMIKSDEQGLRHSGNGPAIEFSDGWNVCMWHGLRVPREWILEKSLTPKVALSEENAELRRAACEILEWDNVLKDPSLNPKVIDEDQPHIGTLIEVDLPDAPAQRFIKYKCGTGRWFAEAVNDKSFDTALKANAGGNGWRGNGNPHDFIPFIRS